MKNRFSAITKLVAVVACAFSLGSCSRAEYAMLPKGSSYGGPRASTPVPATIAPLVAAEMPATTPPAPAPVEGAPAAPAGKTLAIANAKQAAAETPATVATAPVKLNLVQRLALAKISKKVEKVTQSPKFNRHANTAATQRLDSNLRTAILLAIVGVALELIGAVISASIISIIGHILVIVGVVFFIIWLVDKL